MCKVSSILSKAETAFYANVTKTGYMFKCTYTMVLKSGDKVTVITRPNNGHSGKQITQNLKFNGTRISAANLAKIIN